jgi:hypothetical protein
MDQQNVMASEGAGSGKTSFLGTFLGSLKMGGALGETRMCGSTAITQGLKVAMIESGTNDKDKEMY